MVKDQIEAYFKEHRQEMVEDICRLVRIRSAREEAAPGMPYGPGPARALAEALTMAEEKGFATKNFDNYVGTINFNDQETELGILAHLDVVPEGTGWTKRPYEPVVEDGRVYGRGTADDKGPAVAALYAMMAVKDMGIPLKKNVRLIVGTDEECGSSDLRYYFQKEDAPPKSFSPDASYPVINIEKGHFSTRFRATWPESRELPRLVKLEGGHTANVVAQEAFALIEGLDAGKVRECCTDAEKRTGARFTVEDQGQLVRVDVKGQSAHASTPLKGNNAALALIEAVCAMPMAKTEGFAKLCAVAQLFPHDDCRGKALGIAQQDEISGELTLNVGIFRLDETSLEGSIDSRTPICANEDNCSLVAQKKLAEHGIAVDGTKMMAPHHTPADSPFVQTLLKAYEEYSGRQGACVAIGGGTYVHNIEGGVAFGCSFPETENNMHGPDEFAIIDDLILSAKIFTQVILDICA